MKNVLVTGATGALGKALVALLRMAEEYCVIPASRSCKDIDGFKLDVCDYYQVSAAIKKTKPDLLIHLAATFSADFGESYTVNVNASQILLNAIKDSSLHTRVVLIGSAAEYGLISPEENPVKEDRVLHPVSVYGLTKAWQTQLGGMYAGQGGDIVTARVFNLKGQGLSGKLFIGRLEKQISEVLTGKKSLIELGTLTAIRDYISTDQAAEQIISIAKNGKSGNIYHVASGMPITMRDLLVQQLSLNNLDISIVRESVESTGRTGYDVPVIYADITKTMQLMRYDKTRV